jgi:hypothetical protein
MFRALLRLFGWFVLAGGVIVAIADATRSVAANRLELTGLGEVLEAYAPSWAAWLSSTKDSLLDVTISNWPLSNVIDLINAIPVALLAAVLFVLIYALGSRKRETRHF